MVLVPAIIFKCSQHTAGTFRTTKNEDYWYGYSENGYNDSYITLEYMEKIFHPKSLARATRPDGTTEWRLLIFDGFDGHVDTMVVEFCWQNRIVPLCLPPHTAHVLQPLDVGVFASRSIKTWLEKYIFR
jgi:hypothetical protein